MSRGTPSLGSGIQRRNAGLKSPDRHRAGVLAPHLPGSQVAPEQVPYIIIWITLKE